jgi:hypothetical protein
VPLSSAEERELLHRRNIDLKAYRRKDGLYDVEGHIIDVKPFTHHLIDSHRAAGEPVHDMWLRLTIDRQLVVQSAEAKLDVGAHRICPLVAPNFEVLKGAQIGPGWNRIVRERVGRGKGCTHLVEMLAQMATAAMQAMWQERDPAGETDTKPEDRKLSEGFINSCFAYRQDSPFVRDHFPSQYQPTE